MPLAHQRRDVDRRDLNDTVMGHAPLLPPQPGASGMPSLID